MDAQSQEVLQPEEAIRCFFHFRPQEIPGEPGARSISIADAFMLQHFNRRFDWERDHVYTPAGIDDTTDRAKRPLFVILDINKRSNSNFQSQLLSNYSRKAYV
jgi:hypothetical protein